MSQFVEHSFVVTVFGPDRPGIIAEVTAALHGQAANIEDSTMTILRGRLAMMLVVSASSGVELERALASKVEGDLQISVREAPYQQPGTEAERSSHLLSVHGGDRPGIVSAVTGVVAEAGGNITDLTTRLAGGLYVLVAEVDLPAAASVTDLQARLTETGQRLGVEVALRPADSDLL